MTQPKEPIIISAWVYVLIGIAMCLVFVSIFVGGVLFERWKWNLDCKAMGMRHTDQVYACFAREKQNG